jgi:hypothetical protein
VLVKNIIAQQIIRKRGTFKKLLVYKKYLLTISNVSALTGNPLSCVSKSSISDHSI